MKKIGVYCFVFNDVQFALDVTAARMRLKFNKTELARKIGKKTATWAWAIENGDYGKHLLMRDFIALCEMLELHPFDYFEMEQQSQEIEE